MTRVLEREKVAAVAVDAVLAHELAPIDPHDGDSRSRYEQLCGRAALIRRIPVLDGMLADCLHEFIENFVEDVTADIAFVGDPPFGVGSWVMTVEPVATTETGMFRGREIIVVVRQDNHELELEFYQPAKESVTWNVIDYLGSFPDLIAEVWEQIKRRAF